MIKGRRKEKCCEASSRSEVMVAAIVTIDDRGQMVLPKEIRKKAGLAPGDKLSVVTRERDGKVCCIYLIKNEEVSSVVKDRFGDLFQDSGDE
ncbi:MAG: AbrB/MazE/SpoVT family DNA-binding domain-containing protein [Methanomassiliicoccus sp.]|nr:AbrB/MazE/SpoVT family DNA-binding domain-containing protein [Methanomassiliicoccus sp.]